MIAIFFVLLCCLESTYTHSFVNNLLPIIPDHPKMQSYTMSHHQILVQHVDNLANDVHYMHIRLPIYFKPILNRVILAIFGLDK